MSQPYFSIIIPCLNEEKAIPFLLSDIKDQAFKDYEVIVVDANSSDSTRDKVAKFPEIKLLVSDKRNVSCQRNLGVEQARGEYLIFLDADSRIKPYFLSGLSYKTLSEEPDMFTCWAEVSNEDKENKIIVSLLNMALELSKFMDSPAAVGTMMGFKRSVFNDLRGFDSSVTYGEDTEIVKRGHRLGYNFEMFRDPRYIYSLRRFRAEGTLTMLRTYAKLNSRMLIRGFPTEKLDRDYPMAGGTLYEKYKQKNRFLDQIENSLKKVKQLTNAKKWEQYWERLLSE